MIHVLYSIQSAYSYKMVLSCIIQTGVMRRYRLIIWKKVWKRHLGTDFIIMTCFVDVINKGMGYVYCLVAHTGDIGPLPNIFRILIFYECNMIMY